MKTTTTIPRNPGTRATNVRRGARWIALLGLAIAAGSTTGCILVHDGYHDRGYHYGYRNDDRHDDGHDRGGGYSSRGGPSRGR